jgi:hypothetical protein
MTLPPRVVYVCSAARCGSTVLDMFLGSHPAVASLGEVNLVGKALSLRQDCTCGVPLPDCPAWCMVWQRILERTGRDMRADPYGLRLWDARARVIVDRAHQTPAYERAVRLRSAYLALRAALPGAAELLPLPKVLVGAIEAKLALYEEVAGAWDRRVVVDSSKNPWEAVELARRARSQVLVVLLTRDGRGVFHSRRSSGFSREESLSGWRRYYGRTASLLRAKLPAARVLELRYEDFARDPEAAGHELCARLGIEYDAAMPRLDTLDRHMVNGNDTRFRPQTGVRLDERWRRELPAEDLQWFEQRAGALNRRLGYHSAVSA